MFGCLKSFASKVRKNIEFSLEIRIAATEE